MEYKKLNEQISDPVNDNVKALANLFPSSVKDGEVDFEALKEELGKFSKVGKEKYEFTWAGKQASKKKAQEPVLGRTLKYVPEDSKDADTTQNLYIEGDNLEVLKLLRENYYGSIKMIYIDPPYNTGNDFIYNDDFKMTQEESDKAEGDIDKEGNRLIKNQKSNNRFHARWLNMMYPRLRLAKDLLTQDGVIFISIDDNEVADLKQMCDEILGEENLIGNLPRKTKSATNDPDNNFNNQHDYVFIYAKSNKTSLMGKIKDLSNYKNLDNDINGKWISGDPSAKSGGEGTYFKIINPYNKKVDFPPKGRYWAFNEKTYKKYVDNGKIKFKKHLKNDERGFIFKRYLSELKSYYQPFDSLYFSDNLYMNQVATKYLKDINIEFEYSKPIRMISDIIKLSVDKNSLILDFFSGSSTTADAVMQLNAEDGGHRKFIMVQLPEPCDEKSEAYKAKFKNICEIGKERIRRAGDKIKKELKEKQSGQQSMLKDENKVDPDSLDIGFKVFKTGDTNIRWTHEALKNGQIDMNQNAMSNKDKLDFMPGFKDIDVVYEVLLRQRDVPLSSKIEKLNDIGDRTYMFAESFVVCLEEKVDKEMIENLAAIEPLPIKYVFRDSAFEDDIELKDETFRRLNVLIERNTGENGKAYTVEFI